LDELFSGLLVGLFWIIMWRESCPYWNWRQSDRRNVS